MSRPLDYFLVWSLNGIRQRAIDALQNEVLILRMQYAHLPILREMFSLTIDGSMEKLGSSYEGGSTVGCLSSCLLIEDHGFGSSPHERQTQGR